MEVFMKFKTNRINNEAEKCDRLGREVPSERPRDYRKLLVLMPFAQCVRIVLMVRMPLLALNKVEIIYYLGNAEGELVMNGKFRTC